MKKLILLIITVLLIRAENIYILWLGDDFNKNVEKVIRYSISKKFNEFKLKKIKNYEGLYSFFTDAKYYTDKTKLIDGLNSDSRLRNDGIYYIFKLDINKDFISLIGVKFYKDNGEFRVIPLKLFKKLDSKNPKYVASLISKMIYFFISLDFDWNKVSAKGINPLFIKKDKIKVYYFKNVNIMLTQDIDKDYVELAEKLGLISTYSPWDFCKLIGMEVAHKQFTKDDEVSLEDYYVIDDFISGFLIRKFSKNNYEDKNFKCESTNGLIEDNFEDYLYYKLGIDSYFKVSFLPVKGDFYLENNKTYAYISNNNGEVYSFEFYNGEWKKRVFGKSYNQAFIDKLVVISKDNIKIHSILNNYINHNLFFQKEKGFYVDNNRHLFINKKYIKLPFKVTYVLEKNGDYIIGGENGNLIKLILRNKKRFVFKGLKGRIEKIVSFSDDKIGVITDKGEFVIYSLNSKTNYPIKSFPLLGYPYGDISSKGNYIMLINQNYYIYFINKNILFKGFK